MGTVHRLHSHLTVLGIRPTPNSMLLIEPASAESQGSSELFVLTLSSAAKNLLLYLLHSPGVYIGITVGWTIVPSLNREDWAERPGPPIMQPECLTELANHGLLNGHKLDHGKAYGLSPEGEQHARALLAICVHS